MDKLDDDKTYIEPNSRTVVKLRQSNIRKESRHIVPYKKGKKDSLCWRYYLMITEEKIVDMAYTAAEKLYNMNYNGMKSLSIDKDDFMQDAVMYILDLYRKDYMHLDIESKAPGMVMKMLKTFVLNLFQVTNKKAK